MKSKAIGHGEEERSKNERREKLKSRMKKRKTRKSEGKRTGSQKKHRTTRISFEKIKTEFFPCVP